MLYACQDTEDTDSPFYPIDGFFKREITLIDSLPLAIFHIHTEKKVSDTSIFSKEEFKKMTSAFFMTELDGVNKDNGFSEMVIHDEQLKETTLSYAKEMEGAGLFKIELHIKDGESNVGMVYLERHDLDKNIERSRKILWRTGKEMIVQTMAYTQGQEIENRTDRFKWSLEN